MALYLHLANFIVNKSMLDDSTLTRLKEQLRFDELKFDLPVEDEYLMNIPAMNFSDVDETTFEELNIPEEAYCCIVRYGGKLDECNWVNIDKSHTVAYHIDETKRMEPKINRIDTIPVIEIEEKYGNLLTFLENEILN